MVTLSADTSPRAEKVQIEIIRHMPSWKKLAMVDDLNETIKALAINDLKRRYPDASPEQIRRKLASLILGEELADKVHGHAR